MVSLRPFQDLEHNCEDRTVAVGKTTAIKTGERKRRKRGEKRGIKAL